MKHIYLITAFNNLEPLKRTLSLLDRGDNIFMLHIDVKAGDLYSELTPYVKQGKLICMPQQSLSWAGDSLLKYKLDMMEYALKFEWDYCHYISDSDIPLKTAEQIDKYFEKWHGWEFIDFAPENYEFAHYKCDVYHFFTDFPAYRTSKILKGLNHIVARAQKAVGFRRRKIELRHGSAFFSITRELTQYIIERKEQICRDYRFTLVGEEVWLQTVCYHSPFISKVKSYEQEYVGNVRYIDWKRRNGNSPYTFTSSDYDELIGMIENSECCFARKINGKDDLAERVYQYLDGKTKDYTD